jgi:hypothetical protein
VTDLIAKGREIVLAAPQLYIDVDIETDGWAGFGSMLSLGAVAPNGAEFYREIQPCSEDFVPHQRQFCEEHGLERERLLQEARHYIPVMLDFHRWVRRLPEFFVKTPVFTAFNAGFDFGFVHLYFLKAGLTNPFGTAPFDIKSLALALEPGWDWSRTSKSQLPSEVVPQGDFTHHALEDARYQQQLHFGMAGLTLGKPAEE